MSDYDNELRFFLFPNINATPENKQPQMTGEITIEGKKYKLSGWKALSKKGDNYLQGRAQKDDGTYGKKKDSSDDGIPF